MYEIKQIKWSFFITIFGIFQSTQAATLCWYKSSLDDYYSTPLATPLPVLTSSYVDKSKPTVIYAFGHNEAPNSTDVEAILKAYLQYVPEKNLCLVNWEEEASQDGGLGSDLGYAVFSIRNTRKVGETLGDSIAVLVNEGGLNGNIHLVGHSLGAHLMGFAGKEAQTKGYTVKRITGLDPAGPLYDLSLKSARLDSSDAEYVDVVHTNPQEYGTKLPLGKVNYWVNYGTKDDLQPGCQGGTDVCSHQRSVYYFAASLKSPTDFPGAGASGYNSWYNGDTNGEVDYIGEETDTQASGNFYLSTNGQSPYGKGQDGLKPSSDETAQLLGGGGGGL